MSFPNIGGTLALLETLPETMTRRNDSSHPRLAEQTTALAESIPETRPVTRLTEPLKRFASADASGGIVLLFAALLAIVWANSSWSDSYFHLWEYRLGFIYEHRDVSRTLHFWINDALMAVFFLMVGLEIKREVTTGHLASPRRAGLPIAAAFGGVLIPALIYAGFNWAGPGQRGWGVPMATDIAFVAGALAILGKRVPSSLVVFLTALAIVDDLFAVLVIAIFYTAQIHAGALFVAALLFLFLLLLNRIGVAHPAAYAIPGLLLWVAILESGVHSTIAGVLLAIAIPGRRFLGPVEFISRSKVLLGEFESGIGSVDEREQIVQRLEGQCRHVQPPLHRIEHGLRPWVGLVIMPLFAFANAGVRITPEQVQGIGNPVTLGVLLGLFLGKPAGIFLFSFLSHRLGLTALPEKVTWAHVHGAGWLAGIGFTMSLFVAGLAFGESVLLDNSKIAILCASLLAGITGSILLIRLKPRS